jgi:hypothetical protein
MKIGSLTLYTVLAAAAKKKAAHAQTNNGNGQRCDRTQWRPNYNSEWSTATCSQNGNCNWPGYSTELACCKGEYGGQASGACLQSLPNPPTTSPTKEGGLDVWYPDYETQWSDATCKNDYPLPNGRPTYSSQLACCKGAYAGQMSGACLAQLPNPPTTSPTMEGGAPFYYPVYEMTWSEGYCSNELPLPYNNVNDRPNYPDMLACCKGSYAGQMSGTCLQMLPNPPTTSPTTEGGLDYWEPDYDTNWSEATCKNERRPDAKPGDRPQFDSMLECCKRAYAGQSSGACLQALPNPPTTSPTTEEGEWYVDRNQDWNVGTCSNAYPTNRNEGTYETQEDCCRGVYSTQDSDACMCDVDPCHSCKCFDIASARDKIKDRLGWTTADIGGGDSYQDVFGNFDEFHFKNYCNNPSGNPLSTPIAAADGGTNPDLTFDECCQNAGWGQQDRCMCRSEPCHSCDCYNVATAVDALDKISTLLSLSTGTVDDLYEFDQVCSTTAGPAFLRNTNLEQCYDDPTKQPTPAPTKARRLGEAKAPAVN